MACGPTGLTIHHRHAWNLFLKSRFFTKQSKPQTKWILDAHHSKPPNSISFCHLPSPISDRKGGTFEASWLVQAWNKSSCLNCPFSSGADLLMQTFPFRTSSQCRHVGTFSNFWIRPAGIWGGCVPLKFPWRYFTQFQTANKKHGTQGNTRPLGLVVLPGGFGREIFGVLQADLFAFASPLFLGVWRLYKVVHPARLTWNLQITHLEGKMIFQTSMIMFHVSLPGCTLWQGSTLRWYNCLRFVCLGCFFLIGVSIPLVCIILDVIYPESPQFEFC